MSTSQRQFLVKVCSPYDKSYNHQMVPIKTSILLLSVTTVIAMISSGAPTSPSLWQRQQYDMHFPTNPISIPNSLYIPGGGFSGVPYRFGQLQNIPNHELQNQTNVCYSAGCLALIARYQNWSAERLVETAKNVQEGWYAGEYPMQDMLKHYINELVDTIPDDTTPDWMSKLMIMTSELSSNSLVGSMWKDDDDLQMFHNLTASSTSLVLGTSRGLSSIATVPNSKEALRTKLLQSAWLPFLTGSSLVHQRHMDGSFTSMFHPKCSRKIQSGTDWKRWLNFVNPVVSAETSYHLVNAGRTYRHGII